MKGLALLGLVAVTVGIFSAVRYLIREEHQDKSSGTDQFSPGDSAKSDLGPNPP
jgi:hypothetical protein